MGVVLYRPGTTHNIRGVQCELKVFNESSYLPNLGKGWFYSPGECYAEKKQDEKKETKEKDIRQLAKDKGIKSWHNKSIKRLKQELEEWQPEI